MRFLMIYFSLKFGKRMNWGAYHHLLETGYHSIRILVKACRSFVEYLISTNNSIRSIQRLFLPLFPLKNIVIFRGKWLISAFLVEIRSYNVSNTYRNMSILLRLRGLPSLYVLYFARYAISRKKPILCQKWLRKYCSGSFQSCFRAFYVSLRCKEQVYQSFFYSENLKNFAKNRSVLTPLLGHLRTA